MTVEDHVDFVIAQTHMVLHDYVPWPWNLVQAVDSNKSTPWEVLESLKKLTEDELEVIIHHYLHNNPWSYVSRIMYKDRKEIDILHMKALEKMRSTLKFDRETERVRVIAPTSIRALGLPKVISNSLFRAKIFSIPDLAKLSDEELLEISGLGVTRVAAIREALNGYLKGEEKMPKCEECKWLWDGVNGRYCHNEWVNAMQADLDDYIEGTCPFFDPIEEVNEQYEPEDIWN